MSGNALGGAKDFNIDPSQTDAEAALMFIEQTGRLLDIPVGRREQKIFLLLNSVYGQRQALGLKLWRFVAALHPGFENFHLVQPLSYAYGLEMRQDDADLCGFSFDETGPELAELAIEKIGLSLEIPGERRIKMIALIVVASMITNGEFGEKLRMATTAISGFPYVIVTEIHNPPSLTGDSGFHLQLDERGEFYHTPLEDVLRRLASTPTSGPGGALRDISDPIDYGNKMRVGPQAPVIQIGGETGKEGFGGSDRKPK